MPTDASARPSFAAPAQEETLRRLQDAERYNAWLLDRCRNRLGERVLDAGAGTGTFAELLAAGGHRVVALEPDPTLAELLHERLAGHPDAVVVECDLARLGRDDLPDGAVDSIVCFNVLEHLTDDAAGLRALSDALARAGTLFLLVPAHPFLFGSMDESLGHERRYARRALRELLEGAGFRVEQLRHVNAVGALGWLVWGRLLRSDELPAGPISAFDALVPLVRRLDRLPLPFGLSLWAVARPAR